MNLAVTIRPQPEEWRAVAEFPTHEVSNLGQIRNRATGLVLKQRPNGGGYPAVSFSPAHRVCYHRAVHRLVCTAFHGEPAFDRAEAAHLDGCKTNNAASNLAWVSSSENNRHKHRHGTVARGERNGFSVLVEADVLQIRREFLDGDTYVQVARRHGVSEGCVNQIKNGRSWAWLVLPQDLADLRDAGRDYNEALVDIALGKADADDRATEAETRREALRDAFEARFRNATGLTWGQIEAAIQEAVL